MSMVPVPPGHRLPIVLSIDVEPDEHTAPPDRPAGWRGFELVIERLPRLRAALIAATGQPVQFCWTLRMDPAIATNYGAATYVAHRYGALLDRLRAAGDAIGVHPHAWRWDRERRRWIADHASPAWVEECVEVSFAAYREAFGTGPDFHKFGGRFMDSATMNQVGRLGCPIDTTVEPGEPPELPGEHLGGIYTGLTADFTRAPRRPYRPDANDFCREAPGPGGAGQGGAGAGLWELPMTAGTPVLKRPPARDRAAWAARHPVAAGQALAGKIRRQPVDLSDSSRAPRYRPLSMWLDWRSPTHFWNAAFAAAGELEQPYLAFGVRSEFPLVPSFRETFDGIIEHLASDRRAAQLAFETPAQLLDRLGLTGSQLQQR